MYVNIGLEISIPVKMIVAILDLDICTSEKDKYTKEFLKRAEEDNNLVVINGSIPRSIIITLESIYLSPLSSDTLKERIYNSTYFDF